MTPPIRLFVLVSCLSLAATGRAADVPHHDLRVTVDPQAHTLEAVDRIRPGDTLQLDEEGGYRFALHAGLAPRIVTRHWALERVPGEVDALFFGINATRDSVAEDVPLEGWRLIPRKRAGEQVEVHYGGVIDHPLAVQGEVVVPPDRTAVIRFKGAVPTAALLPHVLAMFFGVLWGLRTLLEALTGRRGLGWLTYTTLGLIGVGGMFLGPVVQKYAFGAFWTGVPFGWDLTDNKTLVMFLCWLAAAVALRWRRSAPRAVRWGVAAAAAVMVVVYLIPHSMYGSQLDYDQVDSGVDPSEAIGQG